MTVTVSERPGYPKEHWGQDFLFQAERLLEFDWPDRYSLVTSLGGPSGVGGLYPYSPAIGARVFDIKVTPLEGSGQKEPPGAGTPVTVEGEDWDIATYNRGLCHVVYQFSTKTPQLINGQWLTEDYYTGLQATPYPRQNLLWGGSTAGTFRAFEQDEAPVIYRPHMILRWTFHSLSAIPPGAVPLVGHVNDANFTAFTLGITFPPETVLFKSVRILRSLQLGIIPKFVVVYEFAASQQSWNKALDVAAIPPAWREFFYAGDGTARKPYTPSDLTAAFPP